MQKERSRYRTVLTFCLCEYPIPRALQPMESCLLELIQCWTSFRLQSKSISSLFDIHSDTRRLPTREAPFWLISSSSVVRFVRRFTGPFPASSPHLNRIFLTPLRSVCLLRPQIFNYMEVFHAMPDVIPVDSGAKDARAYLDECVDVLCTAAKLHRGTCMRDVKPQFWSKYYE